ncbi:MAG: SRPBCC family protein [Kineosporiaceae bacterium]
MTAVTPGDLELDIPADEPVIRFRRFLRAPRDLVFRVMSEPEHRRHWWGPRSLDLVVAEADLRVGGTYRYVSRTPDGQEFAFHGEFREVDPPRRVVQTSVFEGFPDAESVEAMDLVEVDGGTMVHGLVTHSSIANRDGHVNSGMEPGMRETYERLDELLAALVAA